MLTFEGGESLRLYRNFTSQEEIDLEYDLALTVPDLDYWIDWYTQESLSTRNKFDCMLEVSFGSTADETIDIFPTKEPGAPILVFIHGGYWVVGNSKDYSFVANGFVNQGINVVVTNYSLCPQVTISEITHQTQSVIAWLYKNAINFNADPSRIFVAGHSAGGHQVGTLVNTDWSGEYALPDDIIKGGITISGIFDLQPLFYSFLQPKLLLTNKEILLQSPLLNIPQSGPPLLVTFGKKETKEFQRQSTEYLQEWKANGLRGELLVQKGKHHFSVLEGLHDANSTLCHALIDFIK